jgi:hypothetical protein
MCTGRVLEVEKKERREDNGSSLGISVLKKRRSDPEHGLHRTSLIA